MDDHRSCEGKISYIIHYSNSGCYNREFIVVVKPNAHGFQPRSPSFLKLL